MDNGDYNMRLMGRQGFFKVALIPEQRRSGARFGARRPILRVGSRQAAGLHRRPRRL